MVLSGPGIACSAVIRIQMKTLFNKNNADYRLRTEHFLGIGIKFIPKTVDIYNSEP